MDKTILPTIVRSPLAELRYRQKLSIQEAADQAGVHYTFWFNTEKGSYNEISKKILKSMTSWREEIDFEKLKEAHRDFISILRQKAGERYKLSEYGHGSPLVSQNPFIIFRESLGLSRAGFGKTFGVQPNVLYRLEHGQSRTLPSQVREALLDAGMNGDAVADLDERVEEFYERDWFEKLS